MTLRERLGAAYVLSAHLCEHWGDTKPCPGCLCAKEIEAALAILDAADYEWVKGSVVPPGRIPGRWRLVSDPEQSA